MEKEITEKEADEAALFYKTHIVLFEEQFKALSKKEKDHVAIALQKHPIEDVSDVILQRPKLEALVNLGVAILNAKLTMFSFAAETVEKKKTDPNNKTKGE